jgi:hypothetical protein
LDADCPPQTIGVHVAGYGSGAKHGSHNEPKLHPRPGKQAGPAALQHACPEWPQSDPQPFGPASPPPHVAGSAHVSGQVIVCPQLLVALPHDFPLHGAVLSGVQHVSPTHTSDVDEQLTVPPLPQATC